MLENVPTKKGRGGWYVQHSVVKQNEGAKLNFPAQARGAPIFIDPAIVSIYDIDLRVLHKRARHLVETARQVAIIGIKPSDNVAGGPRKAFVQSMALSPIRLGDPTQRRATRVCRPLLQNCDGSVGRSAINDEVLHIALCLKQDAVDGVADEAPLIKGWSYYRK